MNTLPQPDDASIAHSKQLQARLIDRIKKQGPISFQYYMEQVLYEPGLGYYMAGQKRFGAGGDFITAPELSPAFAYCLANLLDEFHPQPHYQVLEFGAGSGQLAADLLLCWQQNNHLPEKYFILEPSPSLQQQQRHTIEQLIPSALSHVTWLETLPQNFSGAMIANEVLDAMPCHLIHCHADEIVERCVDWQDEQFVFSHQPLSAPLKKLLAEDQFAQLSAYQHYNTEINLLHRPWLQALYDSFKTGSLTLIDYGYNHSNYYHPERHQGTLRCHYQQLAHDDPFFYPGLQDITSHVNFSQLITQSEQIGFTPITYQTQAQFLMDNGLIHWAQQQHSADFMKQRQMTQAILQLTEPQHMGEIFKILALQKAMA